MEAVLLSLVHTVLELHPGLMRGRRLCQLSWSSALLFGFPHASLFFIRYYISQDSLELLEILLPQLQRFWDVLPCWLFGPLEASTLQLPEVLAGRWRENAPRIGKI